MKSMRWESFYCENITICGAELNAHKRRWKEEKKINNSSSPEFLHWYDFYSQ